MKNIFSISTFDTVLSLFKFTEDEYVLTVKSKNNSEALRLTMDELQSMIKAINSNESHEETPKPKTKTVYKYAFKHVGVMTHFYESAGFYETVEDFEATYQKSVNEKIIVIRLDHTKLEVPA